MGYHYCGNKIEVFEKQGTSYRASRDKAEVIFIEMADEIKKYTAKMNYEYWNDHQAEILARLKRNKDILLAETKKKKIFDMINELYDQGFIWTDLQGETPFEVYHKKVLDHYITKDLKKRGIDRVSDIDINSLKNRFREEVR